MNELEALELSIKLWQDIVDNNLYRKEDSKFFDRVKGMNGRCPLCQYYRSDRDPLGEKCTDCPLAYRKVYGFDDYPCLDEGQPYASFNSIFHDETLLGSKGLLDKLIASKPAIMSKVGK